LELCDYESPCNEIPSSSARCKGLDRSDVGGACEGRHSSLTMSLHPAPRSLSRRAPGKNAGGCRPPSTVPSGVTAWTTRVSGHGNDATRWSDLQGNLFCGYRTATGQSLLPRACHVVQWDRLGVDNFLYAYAIGLLQHGYQQSPLEQMAFQLQVRFDQRRVPENLVEFINEETDGVWEAARRILEAG